MTVNAYAVGGTAFTIQPTSGKWLARGVIGLDGNGRAIYEPLRSFEITWQLSNFAEFSQIQDWFENIGSTGSYVVSLPRYGFTSYTFYNYSGCFIDEPVMDRYFNQNILNVTMLIRHIRE